jgi:hypothetical protein
MRLLALSLSILAASLLPSAPAWAGKKDDAWAKCLWEQVPTTSANWLAMSPQSAEKYSTGPETPDKAIVYRLRAACERLLTPPGKKWPPSMYAKNVRVVLAATRPAVIGQDKAAPKAIRCDYYFENDKELKTRARFEWGVEDEAGRTIWTTTDFGFAGAGGGAVYLTKGAGIKKCFTVRDDGTLADA